MRKKKFITYTLLNLILLNNLISYAEDNLEQPTPNIPAKSFSEIKLKTNFSFGYDYNFGFAKVENGKVLVDKNNLITLDDRFRNTLYVNDLELSMQTTFFSILKTNLSASLFSSNFNAEPLLSIDSYREYAKFLVDRKSTIKNIWQRFLILKDVNFEVNDEATKGKFVLGQQLIPFSYVSDVTLNQPISNYPLITPMTDYINFNLNPENQVYYQNSTLTNYRDLGFMLTGNYPYFRFFTALYNGSGSNIFDNNNEKDLFGRLDLILGNFEIGVSHLRGKHFDFKNLNEKALDIEVSKTSFHSKLGTPNLYLTGDYILAQNSYSDKTVTNKNGWYAEGVLKAESIFSGALRYESFFDDNVLINKEKNTNYNIKRFVANFSQNINENIISKQEYTHTWEDLNYDKSKFNLNYGTFTANIQFKF
ncbi:MAG: hypothetical protein U0457_07215 [Candidatus Sericytochromatia bacterium]